MSEPDQSSGGRIREIGNCEVLAKVGQGGMGTVFRARQKSLDRIVALKVLPPSVAKDASFIDRFQREARASAKFSHPHIVNGIDVGQDAATGLWYFVMEFVDGPSLKDVQKKRGTLPESEVLKLARQLAGALDCLAANGMVHRDIKPDNVMLNERGDAKLADLGLAKDLREDSSLTQSGRAVGTPYYMSPEQVRGETTGIDIRADIYALGGTLFHLLTGRPPFQGETSAVIMAKHLTEAPPLASKINASVSEGCARMIARMMAKKKEDRVQTPRELIDIIDKVVAGEYGMTTGGRAPIRGTGPRSAIKTKTSVREEKPRGFLMPAALAGVVVLGVGAYLAFGSASKPVAQTPPATVQQPKREVETPKQKLSTPPPPAHAAPVRVAAPKENAKPAEKKLEADAGAADEIWKTLETRSQAASNGGDIDSALEVLAHLPEAHAPLLLDRAETLAGKLRTDAEMRINAALKLAEDASARAEPKAGLEALAGIESTRYAPLAASVKALRERLESESANAGELKRRKEIQDARTQLAAHLARFEKALLEERNLAAARSVADEAAKDTRLAPIENEAKALGEIVAAHEDYNARTVAACEVLKGRQVKINKDEGILGEVKDGVISLRLPGPGGANNFGIKKIRLADLTDAQRKDLLKVEWGTTAAANVAAAMQKLREPEDLPGATVLLATSTDFPLHAIYDERLQVKLKGAEEVAAEKGWAALDEAVKKPLATPEQGQALMAVVEQYMEKHGGTKFAKSRAEALGAVRSAAEKATTVNLVKNGDFEDNSPAGLALWKKEGGNEFLINEKAHHGDFGYCMIGPGRIYQSLDVQPGVTYRLTCNVSGGGACAVVGSLQSLGGPERDPKEQTVSFVSGEPGNGSKWKTLEIVYTAHHPKLEVSFNHKSPGQGRIYLDDVLVTRATPSTSAPVAAVNKPATPVAPPPQPAAAMPPPPQPATPAVNVFTNNGFEQGLTGWDVTRAAVHTDSPHTGRNCVQIQNKGRVAQIVKTEAGFTYQYFARVRGKGTAYLFVDRNERSYRELESDEWSTWNATFTATTTSHALEINVRGTVYLDELSVLRGAPAKANDDALLAAQLPPDFHVYKGHAYKIFKEAMSWPEAKKFCEKMGGHLAFIDDEREDEFLKDLARNSGKDVWIGLFDPQNTSQWVWSDGRKMTYNGFNERAIYKRTQARAARYAQFVGYEWAEDPIDKLYFFLCEWDTMPEKLMVKKPAAQPPAAAPQPAPKKIDE